MVKPGQDPGARFRMIAQPGFIAVGRTHLLPQIRIAQQHLDATGEGPAVSRRDKVTVDPVLDRVRDAPHRSHNDRKARGHGLEHGYRKALLVRRQHENGRIGKRPGDFPARNFPAKRYITQPHLPGLRPVAFQFEVFTGFPQKDKRIVQAPLPEQPDRLEQLRDAFVAAEQAGKNHVPILSGAAPGIEEHLGRAVRDSFNARTGDSGEKSAPARRDCHDCARPVQTKTDEPAAAASFVESFEISTVNMKDCPDGSNAAKQRHGCFFKERAG